MQLAAVTTVLDLWDCSIMLAAAVLVLQDNAIPSPKATLHAA